MVYDDRYRTFLQLIIHEGSVPDPHAQTICLKIFENRYHISGVVSLINDKLSPIAMALKCGICELTGDKYWSVVSTSHEESIKIPSEFSQAQREFLKKIYTEIINAETGCIASTVCLNFVSNLDSKLLLGDADNFLKLMVNKKWLHVQNGHVYMGVRSIMELMPYFRATYKDNFHNCHLCREVVFYGKKCENCDEKNTIFHEYCLYRYIEDKKNNKCPKCKHSLRK